MSYLKSEGLAQSLSSGHDHELWAFDNFYIDIVLTQKGLNEVNKVVEAVFQYAQMVRDKGPQEYIFEENKMIGQIRFDFADKQNPMATTMNMAKTMQVFEDEKDLPYILKH